MLKTYAIAILCLVSAACSTGSGLAGSGPSASAVKSATDIQVIELTTSEAVNAAGRVATTSLNDLPAGRPVDDRIGRGEQVEVTLWEAAPSVLFSGIGDGSAAGRAITLPVQAVSLDGTINVPFVGRVHAEGRAVRDIEGDILKGLAGKANRPQAMVRTTANAAQEVTVVGQVVNSVRMPLTPRGERLLDAIAAAGGTRDPIDKATVQVSRGGDSVSVPLDRVIREPRENVHLAANDVVTVYYQPKTFIAMGAVAKVGDVPFEGTGLSLAQALARAGGTVDNRSNPAGVFVARRVDGKQVVYRLNLREPASLFAMREFPMADGDVLYVANAPAAELNKFLSLLGAAVYPLDAVRNFQRD